MAFVVTAVGAAIELGTVAAIATAVAEVGLAMQVVGAVTHDKTLVKWGGYLSIAGGVTSLASGAFGAAAGAAADGAESAAVDGTVDAASDGAASGAVDAAADGAAGAAGDAAAVTAPVANPAADMASGYGGAAPPIDSSIAGSPGYASGASPVDAAGSSGIDASGAAKIDASGASAANISGTPSAASTGSPVNASAAGADGFSDGSAGTYDQNGNFVPSAAHAGANLAPPGSIMDSLKSGIDSTSQWFKGLAPATQAEIAKSLMAIPGGIQAQKNRAAEMALAQQKLGQTSHGSQVPTFGILAKAQKGG